MAYKALGHLPATQAPLAFLPRFVLGSFCTGHTGLAVPGHDWTPKLRLLYVPFPPSRNVHLFFTLLSDFLPSFHYFLKYYSAVWPSLATYQLLRPFLSLLPASFSLNTHYHLVYYTFYFSLRIVYISQQTISSPR